MTNEYLYIALEILLEVMWQPGWEESLGENCSAGKSSLTLCSPVNCSMPGFPVLHCIRESAQTLVHWVGDAIQPSHPLLLLPSIFPNIRVFSNESALASALPVSIQGWFPLGLTGLISLQSRGILRVFSNTTVQKHQFFGAQPSLWSNSHIHTWLLGGE